MFFFPLQYTYMFKFNVDKKYSQIPNYVKAIEYVFGLNLLKQEQEYFL